MWRKAGAAAKRNDTHRWLWVPAQGRDDEWRQPPLLLRRALDEGLAALHLVGERRLVDLNDDRLRIDAEIRHQRLRDVAHHAGLLFFGAARGHVHGNLRHLVFSLCSCDVMAGPQREARLHGHPRSCPSNKTWMPGTRPGMTPGTNGYPHLTSCRASTSRTRATISPSRHENCAGRVSRHSWFEAIAAAALAPSIRSLICTSPRAFSSEPWMITQGELRRSAYLSWLPMFLGLPR